MQACAERRRTADTAALVARVPALREHPLLRRFWPGDTPERVLRLWHHRKKLCAFLDTLPRVLGQGDTYRGNLALEPTPGGEELVAFDWALTGVLPLGADLDRLVAGSTAFFRSPVEELGAVNEAVLDGYVAGPRDAGWRGDRALRPPPPRGRRARGAHLGAVDRRDRGAVRCRAPVHARPGRRGARARGARPLSWTGTSRTGRTRCRRIDALGA